MKRLLAASTFALLLIGCASFQTNAWRTEQTAVNLAYTTYVGYTNALFTGVLKISETDSNAVKQARLKFAASVGVADALLASYGTNGATKPQVQAVLVSLNEQASNIVWLISFLKGK